MQACRITPNAYHHQFVLKANLPNRISYKTGLEIEYAPPSATQEESVNIQERFQNEMLRRMELNPQEDENGQIKDAEQLLEPIVAAIQSLQNNYGAETATAAMAEVLEATSYKFSQGSLTEGLTQALEHVYEKFGIQEVAKVVHEWNGGMEMLFQEETPASDQQLSGLNLAMVRYFDNQVEFSARGHKARTLQFNYRQEYVDDELRLIAGRSIMYVSNPEMKMSGIIQSGAADFKKSELGDDLDQLIDFLRNDIENEKAAEELEALSQDGVFQDGMARAMAIIYKEQGTDALYKVRDYYNQNMSELINEKVAVKYRDEFGDRAFFKEMYVSAPDPGHPVEENHHWRLGFVWKNIRSSDGRMESDYSPKYNLDEIYEQISGEIPDQDNLPSAYPNAATTPSQTGILLDKSI
jgi:hypothetical protein